MATTMLQKKLHEDDIADEEGNGLLMPTVGAFAKRTATLYD